jgi:rhodanese-related sulfurtransferase
VPDRRHPKPAAPPSRPAQRRRRGAAAFGVVLLVPFLWLSFGRHGPDDLPRVEAEVRERFPAVRQVTVDELEALLESPRPPLLIDARAAEEYAVSHLRGAVRAATVAEARAAIGAAGAERQVVLYCSVGYRSSRLARELAEAGIDGVANLEGSIFAWANSGRPVVRGGREVREVHPYDRKWGRLLRRELHATGPDTTGSQATRPR